MKSQGVKEFLKETFLSQPLDHWNDWFEGRDICYAPVLDLNEALNHESVKARDMVLYDDKGHKHLGVPIKFKNEPAEPSFYLSEIGGDNVSILQDAGFSTAEIEGLQASGAIFSQS